jgi:hypothetical protein
MDVEDSRSVKKRSASRSGSARDPFPVGRASSALLGALALAAAHCGGAQDAGSASPDAASDVASDGGMAAAETAPPTEDAARPDDARAPGDSTALPESAADAPAADAPGDASLPDAVADAPLPDATDDAPGADAGDPLIAGLYDPARPSASQECDGTPLTVDDVIAALDPGTGMMFIGPSDYASHTYESIARGALAMQTYRQQCTTLTGCAPWATIGASIHGLYFGLTVSADRTLRAQPYDAFSDAITHSPFVIGGGDFLVDQTSANLRYLARVLVTRRADGSLCASAATPLIAYQADADTTVKSYDVSRTMLRPALTAMTAQTDLPPSDAAPQICDGTPASDPMIATAWFAPGATVASFSGRPTHRRGVTRNCHPLTACSPWSDFDDSVWPALSDLEITGGHISVTGRLLSNTFGATLASGSFTSTLDGYALEGLVSTTCAGQRSVERYSNLDLGPDAVVERYGRERIDVQ